MYADCGKSLIFVRETFETMNKPQITIKDIAKALHVSPSTVSRALKDNPDISQETRDLIHAYAREHHYKPNSLAVNLRASRSNTIGIIVP